MNYIVPKYLLTLLSRRVKDQVKARKLDKKDSIETFHLLRGKVKGIKSSPRHLQMTYFIFPETTKSSEAHKLGSYVQKTKIRFNVLTDKEKDHSG